MLRRHPHEHREARRHPLALLLVLSALASACAALALGFLAPSSASAAPAPTGATRVHDLVETLCLPVAKKTACVSGTIGGSTNPQAGVKVTLTAPDGTKQEITTGADGKFSFTVMSADTYLVSLDPSSLPKGQEFVKPSGSEAGPDGSIKVVTVLGQTRAAILQVRPAGFSTSTPKSDQILNGAVSGIRLGLLLALASVGLSLIYGTTGLSNFAHAEQVTLGGMLGYYFCNKLGMPLVLGIIVVTLLCAATGFVQDRILWRPLRRRGMGLTQLMIVTIGLSLALEYVFQTVVGASLVSVTPGIDTPVDFGPVKLTHYSIVGMVVAVVVLGLVGFVLLRTRIGQATRAVSDNPGLSAASGIDTDRVISLVWTVAAGLAGLGGVFYSIVNHGMAWNSGQQILLLLFAAVTLGGLGTAFGALIGSLVIGLVVELSPVFGIPGDFKYVAPLVILILLLLVRPSGLLGRAQRVG